MKYELTNETKTIQHFIIHYETTETSLIREEYNKDITLYRIRYPSKTDIHISTQRTTFEPPLIRNYTCLDGWVYGGWVENESNLDHEGNCMILGNAMAYNGARIKDNALLLDESSALDNTIISDECVIYMNAQIYSSTITEYSRIHDLLVSLNPRQ